MIIYSFLFQRFYFCLFVFLAPSSVVNSPSPSQNGEASHLKNQQSKIDSIKIWSISTYKCTKQLMFEKLGKTSRTVDSGKK